jgi:hypothetical protein
VRQGRPNNSANKRFEAGLKPSFITMAFQFLLES